MKLYKTGIKNTEYMFIEYNNNNFSLINNEDIDIPETFCNIFELSGPVDNATYTLSSVINFDIKDNIIYNLYLKPIGNYKVNELIDIANECNIELLKDGKKKNKKELYDEINLSKF